MKTLIQEAVNYGLLTPNEANVALGEVFYDSSDRACIMGPTGLIPVYMLPEFFELPHEEQISPA